MNKIAVIGAGTMGNGIAHVFAQSGFSVVLADVSPDSLNKAIATITKNIDRMIAKGTADEASKQATLKNISVQPLKGSEPFRSLFEEVELVVEAATENQDLKFKIFRDLDAAVDVNTILATNTSSISITKIAANTRRAAKVIGMHFMNPVPVMKLVEVIRGYSTSDETTKTIFDLSKRLGKTPVEVNDYPGFVANRILMPMINEAIIALFEGVAGVEEVDNVMKLGMAHPMGPLALADFIGLDVCLSILNVLYDGFKNPKYAPCPLLVNMVASGNLGVKSGRGFYEYSPGSKEMKVVVRK